MPSLADCLKLLQSRQSEAGAPFTVEPEVANRLRLMAMKEKRVSKVPQLDAEKTAVKSMLGTLVSEHERVKAEAAKPAPAPEVTAPEPSRQITPDDLPDAAQAANIKWYHGTKAKGLTAESVDPAVHGNSESLFGLGFYMTDDPQVAASKRYGGGPNGTIYEVQAQPRSVLNFDKPLPPEAIEAIKKGAYSEFKEVIDKASKGTGANLWQNFMEAVRDHAEEHGHPKSEYEEMFQGIQAELRDAGFDAVTHVGGARVGGGKAPHKVLILLDPNSNISAERHLSTIKSLEPTSDKVRKESPPVEAQAPQPTAAKVAAPVQEPVAANPVQDRIDEAVGERLISDEEYNRLADAGDVAGANGRRKVIADEEAAKLTPTAAQPAQSFGSKVDAAAAKVGPEGRYGRGKVFINHLYEAYKTAHPKDFSDIGEFKKALIDANRKGDVGLSRADLVQAMDPKNVRESEANYLGEEFHFVRTDREEEVARRKQAVAIAERRGTLPQELQPPDNPKFITHPVISEQYHGSIQRALADGKPVNAEAARAYGVNMPANYEVGPDGIANRISVPAEALQAVEAEVDTLPPAAQPRWTPEIKTKVAQYVATGNDAHLEGLSKPMKNAASRIRLESAPVKELTNKELNEAIREKAFVEPPPPPNEAPQAQAAREQRQAAAAARKAAANKEATTRLETSLEAGETLPSPAEAMDGEVPEPAPAPPDAPKGPIEQWADDTIRESRGRLHAGLDPSIFAAYAVKAALYIKNGYKKFKEWEKRFLEDVRETDGQAAHDLVKLQTKELWRDANRNYYEYTGSDTPMQEAMAAVNSKISRAYAALGRRDLNEAAATALDVVDNESSRSAHRLSESLRHDFGWDPRKSDNADVNKKADLDMQAGAFVYEGGSRQKLADQVTDLQNSLKASDKIKARWLPIMEYARDNFDMLRPKMGHLQTYTDGLRALELRHGIDSGFVQNYISHLYRNVKEKLGGEQVNSLFGGAGESGRSRYFTKTRHYDSLADAIADGFDPKSSNVADLLEYRAKVGMQLVEQAKLEQWAFAQTDPTTGEAIMKPLAQGDKKAPVGYQRVDLAGHDVYVHDDYADLFHVLYDPSALRRGWKGRALLQGQQFVKHGAVMFDSYHLVRVSMLLAAHSPDLAQAVRRGKILLDYTPHDIRSMEAKGLIRPEDAKFAIENGPKADKLMRSGLMANKIVDALDADTIEGLKYALRNAPGSLGTITRNTVGAIQNFNHFTFQTMTRSAIINIGLKFAERNMRVRDMPEAEAYRLAAKETNEMFGNRGRQGWAKSQTMQDALRLAIFAPQWATGRLANELRSYGQLARIIPDSIMKRKLVVGNAALSTVTMFLGLLAANQAINYATKGNSTFENESGHKFDAWIPDWSHKNGGYYISPLSIAAQYTENGMRYWNQALTSGTWDDKGKAALKAIFRIGQNKMSGFGRAAATALTDRDYYGRPIPNGMKGWLTESALQANPVPIPAGPFLQHDPGELPSINLYNNVRSGALQKQLFGSAGFHLIPQDTAEQKMYSLARPFRNDTGLMEPLSPFSRIKGDVRDQDVEGAQKRMVDLLEAGTVKKSQLDHAFSYHPAKPGSDGTSSVYKPHFYTGNKKLELEFRKMLTPEQMNVYQDALAEQRKSYDTYLNLRQQINPLLNDAENKAKDAKRGVWAKKGNPDEE